MKEKKKKTNYYSSIPINRIINQGQKNLIDWKCVNKMHLIWTLSLKGEQQKNKAVWNFEMV